MKSTSPLIVLALVCLTDSSRAADEPAALTRALIQTHCVKCHGPARQEGDIRLDDLPADVSRDRDRWTAVRDQLRDGLMPPAKEPRIDAAKARTAIAWLTAQTNQPVPRLPNQGNLIPHELLFGKSAPALAAAPARVWRLSPDAYKGFVREVNRGRADGIVQPFTLIPERGIRDFAGLYSIDEPSTEILLRNAEILGDAQTAHEIKDGKVRSKHDTVGEFVKLMDPAVEPTRGQLETAVQLQFRMAIGRKPDAAEVDRFVALYEKCAADGDRPAAVRTMLQAVLLRTDAMYRSELGSGETDGSGRRMLAPREIVRAVSLALCDRRESGLVQAAEKGELTTKEQVAAQVRRILDDPKVDKPGLLRFFREYFEYHRAVDVFKDPPQDTFHEPGLYVSDTDRLVLHILEQDQDVFRELLTTTKSFVNLKTDKNRSGPERAHVPNLAHVSHRGKAPVEHVYGVAEWSKDQPLTLPADKRIGVLMQPSWLAAWSTNFDNDPVRRGRWIRERLLGGTVPDLPIGVAAQVPDEKHRTYRDRLQVTRDESCWKCHQRMDDLGLAFENFDHYGRFRTTETVLDLEATERNVDKKNGKPLGPVYREVPLDTTGLIADSGDARLDGPVKDPRELLRRLADSDRVRQVFVRHAFRFYLGRNESLADARTLQDADRAYVESGGSFKSLLVSLLTSDSYLLRQVQSTP